MSVQGIEWLPNRADQLQRYGGASLHDAVWYLIDGNDDLVANLAMNLPVWSDDVDVAKYAGVAIASKMHAVYAGDVSPAHYDSLPVWYSSLQEVVNAGNFSPANHNIGDGYYALADLTTSNLASRQNSPENHTQKLRRLNRQYCQASLNYSGGALS